MPKNTLQLHVSPSQTSESSEKTIKYAQRPLRDISPDILLRRDVFGRNILHISIVSNNTLRLAELLSMPLSKSLIASQDMENGWNVLHYVFFYKRMACLSILLAYFADQPQNAFLDLLKRKDRCRRDPLSLLGNDAREMFWIPEYINENDDFHLIKRCPADTSRISSPTCWWTSDRGSSGAYAFGSNLYGNLGLGTGEDRAGPTRVSIARGESDTSDFPHDVSHDASYDISRDNSRIRSLRVSTYHSALVTVSGQVYTSGAGKRGRLGHGNSHNSEEYKLVPKLYAVRECVISNGHNLALTFSNRLFSWGSNNYGQLGYESNKNGFGKRGDIYEVYSQEIRYFRQFPQDLIGVAVSNVHSLTYTTETIFFWGLNIGQMGIPVEKGEDFVVGHVTQLGKVVQQPQSISIRESIRHVATCDTCTVVVTEANDVIVFFQNQRVKLPKMAPRVDPSLHFEVFKPSVMTRAPYIKKTRVKSPENIHFLLDTGEVVQCLFNTSSPKNSKYQTLWTPFTANVQAVDMDTANDGSLILCTVDGTVFTRNLGSDFHPRRGSGGTNSKRKFSKVQGMNRVVRVSCTDNFTSFGLLRDEIDPLPYKLQQNDFFKDMEYLSPLVEPDPYRKQDQLLDVDHVTNCYISPRFGDTSGSEITDRLHQMYIERHTTPEISPNTYQAISPEVALTHKQMLRSCIQRTSFQLNWSQPKFCDGQIVAKGITLGFHHGLLYRRSAIFRQLFTNSDQFFVHQNIKGHYKNGTLFFETEIEPIALLVFVHFVYTNQVLDFWTQGSKSDKEMSIRSDFRSLVALFQMDSYESDSSFLRQMSQLDEDFGDVEVVLVGGEKIRCSSFIISRSAFFETILAWEGSVQVESEENGVSEHVPPQNVSRIITPESQNSSHNLQNFNSSPSKYISLENVTLAQMKVILRHLQGCKDTDVLSPEHGLMPDPDEFVNFLLDMIEICDELLLVQLKRLCELAIQSYIGLDNVLVLLSHADGLNAPKLFMSCCWYIYHNLELVVFDPYFKDIDENLWGKVEPILELLDKCKMPDFVVGEKGEVNWDISGPQIPSKLVDDFLFDFSAYNEIYMSDRKGYTSFEPVFEVSEVSRRRKSSKMSRNALEGSFSMAEMRETLQRSSSDRTASESAVDDDDFELVTRRKRDDPRKSIDRDVKVGNKMVGSHMEVPDKEAKKNDANGANSANSGNGGNLAIGRKIPEISKPTPILGETIGLEKRQTKIKFSPAMKLSQKERKAKSQGQGQSQVVVEKEKVELRNPWAKPAINTSEISRAGSSSLSILGTSGSLNGDSALHDLPILGQGPKSGTKKSSKSVKTMSSFFHEDTPKPTQPQKPTKTLQEIQQEQEFARWWEEECKRVQIEEERLMRLARGETPRPRGETQKSRGRGRGRGRGRMS